MRPLPRCQLLYCDGTPIEGHAWYDRRPGGTKDRLFTRRDGMTVRAYTPSELDRKNRQKAERQRKSAAVAHVAELADA